VFPEFVEESLYEVHKKVHPRAVSGIFATWRWALVWITQLVYLRFVLAALERAAGGAVRPLAERKFYILGMIFWPQDVFFLAILLIISAYSLFLFTAVGGRLWCGYACPQTVYTEIFTWIEQKIEGERNARIKLDASPMSGRKLWLRTAKHGSWALVALWTGFTFVGYFTPIKGPVGFRMELSRWAHGKLSGCSSTVHLPTYLRGICANRSASICVPYARFQGVMFDPDTLTITYDTERGEPRGARKKGVDPKSIAKGECVDCGICVQVCPTGIDIRDGLQYECIGCAACIDACDQVMEKMAYPKGLIRYSTEHAIEQHWGWKDIVGHVIRPRVLIYSAILGAICVAFVWGIANKASLRVDVIRDRATLAREVEGGLIENVYRLHVINVSEVAASLLNQRIRPARNRHDGRPHCRSSGRRGKEYFSAGARTAGVRQEGVEPDISSTSNL
jgi:cytochrome c oxidase accessory protein FixG